MNTGQEGTQWQALRAKVNFLQQVTSYPEQLSRIESIETHMSWVFLTGQYAYKLKKPVQLPFVNFSSLEARRHSVLTELDMNRRLASGIYLSVLPLVMDNSGQLNLDCKLERDLKVVDWVLKMRRLPHWLLLNHAIIANTVSPLRLRQAAQKLSKFYLSSSPIKISAHHYLNCLRDRIGVTHKALAKREYNFDDNTLNKVTESLLAMLQKNKAMFTRRVSEQRIVEGHGDLRPEHICLTAPAMLIDRPELDPSERMVDPLEELSFLYIECELLGRPQVADVFLSHYQDISGDDYPPRLLSFYKAMRALNRAKYSAWHIDDPQVENKDRYRHKAEFYLALAALNCV